MMDNTKRKLTLDVLSEECIWMSDGLPRALETNRLPAAALEAQIAAQGWRPVTDDDPESSQIVEILVYGYRNDDGLWFYPDGSTPIRGWRPIVE